MASVEEVTQEDARAWELLQQQKADAALAAKAAEELADQARAQVLRCRPAPVDLPFHGLHCSAGWCGDVRDVLTHNLLFL